MKRMQVLLLVGVGAVVLGFAGTANAADIQSKKDCETADGVTSRQGGMLTCTLPIIDAAFRDESKHVSTCDGEIISGGAFCEIILDPKFKNSKPDCKALERRNASRQRDAERVQMEQDTPMTDAWRCAREKRVKAQKEKRG